MSTLDLAAIEQRASAATPGPWEASSPWSVRAGDDELVAVVQVDAHSADAAFIAHARADVPALAAEVRRLRKLVWCAQHARDVAALRVVEPATLAARLVARGWELHRASEAGAFYVHPRPVLRGQSAVWVAPDAQHPEHGQGVVLALIEAWNAAGRQGAVFELLAEVLPERGPWDAEGGR